MKKTLTLLLLMATQVLSTTSAWAQVPMIEFFDRQGSPNSFTQSWLAKAGLKVIKGQNVPFVVQNKHGLSSVVDEATCTVLAFRVSEGGIVDKFQILDSEPNQDFSQTAMAVIKEWKFEKVDRPVWQTLNVKLQMSVSDGRENFSRIKHKAKVSGYEARCVEPVRDADLRLPQVYTEVGMPDPIYPQPAFLRSHPAGCATIAFRIGPDGVPTDLDLLDAKPDQSFVDLAAIDVQGRHFQRSVAAPSKSLADPQYGFAQFAYGIRNSAVPLPSCMTTAFAAAHYQPSKELP